MASEDTARKQSILLHMNTDHVSSLSLYLQHYAKVPPGNSSSARLVDISYTKLTILDDTRTEHQIPIDPPLCTWSDVRSRLKTLHEESFQALGLSSSLSSSSPSSTISPTRSSLKSKEKPKIIIDKWTAPNTPFQLFLIALITQIIFLQALLHLGFLSRGTFIYEHILKYYPGDTDAVLEWNKKLVPAVAVGLHLVETVIFDLYILRATEGKYGISRGQKLWWQWILSAFIEGIGGISRFRGLVEEKRGMLEKGMKKL